MGEVRALEPRQPTWTHDPKIEWHFDIDIVGGCNLRCPSCPVGNLMDVRNAKGHMKPELLDKIARKAKAECGNVNISLFNWTEPFLHPKLAEMIRTVSAYDIPCSLSSNLNIVKDLEGVLAANPKDIRISLSGFTQERYGYTHKRGDIEVVKRNMAKLAEVKEKVGSSSRLSVAFHRYLGNHEEEEAMRNFAESHGFDFHPLWAYLMPLEKVLAFTGSEMTDVTLSDEDRDVIESFALPLDQALEASRKRRSHPCTLRDHQMAITVTGDVMLCCTAYDQAKYSLGSYVDMPLEEIQVLKYRQDACGACMEKGIHMLFVYGADDVNEIARRNIRKHFPDVDLPPMKMPELVRKKPKSRLARKMLRKYRKVRAHLGMTGR